MTLVETATPAEMQSRAQAAKDQLDKHAFETIQWHFHESTGSPFWLEKKKGPAAKPALPDKPTGVRPPGVQPVSFSV